MFDLYQNTLPTNYSLTLKTAHMFTYLINDLLRLTMRFISQKLVWGVSEFMLENDFSPLPTINENFGLLYQGRGLNSCIMWWSTIFYGSGSFLFQYILSPNVSVCSLSIWHDLSAAFRANWRPQSASVRSSLCSKQRQSCSLESLMLLRISSLWCKIVFY